MMNTRTIPNAQLIPQILEFVSQGRSVTFRVRGYSMRLFLEDKRDLVQLEAVSRPLKVRDVVLAEIAPKLYVLHRIIKIDGDVVTLKGDGNVVGTESCKLSDVKALAVAFYRKGRTKPDLVTGWKWRTYSSIWLALTPFRRYILGVYRRVYKLLHL